MASSQYVKSVNILAGEDLRTSNSRGFGTLLTVEDDSDVGKVIGAVAATTFVVGVLAEEPDSTFDTDGENVPVVVIGGGGVAKCKAAGTITAGDLLVAGTNGGAASGGATVGALVADTMSFGVALESAVANDIFEFIAMAMTSSTET